MHPRTAVGRMVLAGIGCLLVASGPRAADDALVRQLRDDVRALEREVRELARRVDRLQQAQQVASPPGDNRGSGIAPRAQPEPGPWLSSASWDRLEQGMTAQEVIAVLGTPVSMREEGDPLQQVLFYTLSFGDGFLSGSVRLRADRVVAIQRPVLRSAGPGKP